MNMKEPGNIEKLDLKGIPCPQNSARALLALAGMETGTLLEIIIDDGEPLENVPASLEEEGYKIIRRFQEKDGLWHLIVETA